MYHPYLMDVFEFKFESNYIDNSAFGVIHGVTLSCERRIWILTVNNKDKRENFNKKSGEGHFNNFSVINCNPDCKYLRSGSTLNGLFGLMRRPT